MIPPKEKAEKLFDTIIDISSLEIPLWIAKDMALITVDEKINLIREILNKSVTIYQSLLTPSKLCVDILNPILKELEEVKQEILKL